MQASEVRTEDQRLRRCQDFSYGAVLSVSGIEAFRRFGVWGSC